MQSRRHWSVYVPALTISILWAGILFWADRREPPLETLRLLALLVEAVAVPLLFLWAFLRGRGAEIGVSPQSLYVSTGGFRPEKVSADIGFVSNVRVSRSLLQRLLGAGSLEIVMEGDRRLVLDDMSAPEAVAKAIDDARMGKRL